MTVIVYTQPNCQPCNATKRALTQWGIPFAERPAAEHLDYLASIGARSAPVTVRGETVICGFLPDQLRGLGA